MILLRIFFPWFFRKRYVINSTWRFCDTPPFDEHLNGWFTVTIIDKQNDWVKVQRHDAFKTVDTYKINTIVTLYTIPVKSKYD
jgi:hypothetical protein